MEEHEVRRKDAFQKLDNATFLHEQTHESVENVIVTSRRVKISIRVMDMVYLKDVKPENEKIVDLELKTDWRMEGHWNRRSDGIEQVKIKEGFDTYNENS